MPGRLASLAPSCVALVARVRCSKLFLAIRPREAPRPGPSLPERKLPSGIAAPINRGQRELRCTNRSMQHCRMLEITPCADELDELTSLEIYNSVWSIDAVTIDAVHAFRNSAQHYIDYLVREDGLIIGSGVGAIFAYRTHRVVSLVTVRAKNRGRGAGTALYEALSVWAGEQGAREMEASISEDDSESLSFAQRRRFVEERREVVLVLNLADTPPSPVTPPAGIEIVTWAQRPELARGMYEVDVESRPDIPGFADVDAEPFEEWMAHLKQRPTDSPEATFIALADDEVVGYAKLSLTAPTVAGNSMTAVKKTWRGRGIARALKATEINWAITHGYTELHTSNEERNTPINRLNARLGYRPGNATLYLTGPINDVTQPR
jgi:mycothiol synthase